MILKNMFFKKDKILKKQVLKKEQFASSVGLTLSPGYKALFFNCAKIKDSKSQNQWIHEISWH